MDEHRKGTGDGSGDGNESSSGDGDGDQDNNGNGNEAETLEGVRAAKKRKKPLLVIDAMWETEETWAERGST